MKILKARNGIALVAVLAIMLITSLFIPAMFNLSDASLYSAVKGTDRQRALYFSRTITEMSVASFTKIDHKSSGDNPQLTQGETDFMNAIKNLSDSDSNDYKPYGKIETETIYMLSRTVDGEEDIKYASDETTKNDLVSAGYAIRGEGSCTITFDGTVNYYEVYGDGTKIEFNKAADPNDPMNKSDLAKREKIYNNLIREVDETTGKPKLDSEGNVIDGSYTKAVKEGKAEYTLSKVVNKNLVFTSIATVNGIKAEKQCVVVMKVTPSQEDSLVFGSPEIGNSGGNQVFVDPNKATAIVPIKYGPTFEGIQNQPLLVYSCMGNMVINPHNFLYTSPDGKGGVTPDANGRVSSGANGTDLVLGVQPGVNYAENNNPTSDSIDGVNYNEQKDGVQYNNFVAFAASNAIRVELPIDLMVNPCRTGKYAGDLKLDVGGDKFVDVSFPPNVSLYKIMILQAPEIQFAGETRIMASFYKVPNDAKRMSSIVLTAPENTPYAYYNEERKKTVKAGMVYFEQDCVLWVIDYGNNGRSDNSVWGNTIYRQKEDTDPEKTDFKKITVAEAGDVYYFNAEVPATGIDGSAETIGLSLTNYTIETKYAEELKKNDSNSFWNNMKNELAASYLNQQDKTYVKDDMFYLGNIYEVGSGFDVPPIENYYVVWTK